MNGPEAPLRLASGPDAISRDAAVTACAATFLWAEALSLIAGRGQGWPGRQSFLFETGEFNQQFNMIHGNFPPTWGYQVVLHQIFNR